MWERQCATRSSPHHSHLPACPAHAAQEAAKTEAEHKGAALSSLQQELGAAHEAYAVLAAAAEAREGALLGRLEAMRRECGGLLELVERAEGQHAEVERRLQAQLQALGAAVERQGDDEAAAMPALHAACSRLQGAAEGLEVRLLRLEAQAAVAQQDRQAAAAEQWAGLVRSRRYRAAVKQLRGGLQAQLLDVQAACQQQAAQLRELQAALQGSQEECRALAAQLRSGEQQHQRELEAAAALRQQELASLLQQAEEQRQALQQEAAAATAAAVEEAQQRCRVEAAARWVVWWVAWVVGAAPACVSPSNNETLTSSYTFPFFFNRVCQAEQRALQDLEGAEQQCAGLRRELEAAHAEFKRYQQLKAVEVRLLEQRVVQHLQGSSGGGSGAGAVGKRPGRLGGGSAAAASPGSSPPAGGGSGGGQQATVAELQAACGQEGIAAALREASLERLQREQVEADLAAAQEAGQRLEARARAAEQELAGHRSRHAGEARQVRERAERLAAELADCQAALKLARGEGGRRLKELQALQRAAASENAGGNGTAAAAQLEGERRAREAAEAQLREARQGLARKTALIKDLRAKVGGVGVCVCVCGQGRCPAQHPRA